MTTHHPRQPKGVPVGGQFAAQTKSESQSSLGRDEPYVPYPDLGSCTSFDEVDTAVDTWNQANRHAAKVMADPGDMDFYHRCTSHENALRLEALARKGQVAHEQAPRNLADLGPLSDDHGKVVTEKIRFALHAAGLVRDLDNGLSGAENTGWINDVSGSTGYSVTNDVWVRGQESTVKRDPDRLSFHIVVSGKSCGLEYRELSGYDGWDGHEPVQPDRLNPRIKDVFSGIGFEVQHVQHVGYQAMGDDDVSYEVIVKRPAELGPDPVPAPSSSRWRW